MTSPDFLFLVKTPVTYSKNLEARVGFTPEARSHAALVARRRKRGDIILETPSLSNEPSPITSLLTSGHSDGENDGSRSSFEEAFPNSSSQEIERFLTPLRHTIDELPGVPHQKSVGFTRAVEFYSVVNPGLVHAPVFHTFDVSNTFGKSYYEFMREEVSLHAGIAVVNMVRDVFSPDFRETGPSRRSLRLIEVAICKLRQHIEKSVDGYISDDASIVAAMFLGHMASAFGDFEAFRMHRRGIKAMVASRGGLDNLGLNGMLKCSVSQFESWWTQMYGDSVFAEYQPPYAPVYLEEPFSPETNTLLDQLPVGFRVLAKKGKIATDIVTVLSNIVEYEKQIRNRNGLLPQMAAVARLPERKRYSDFWEACSCLLVPGHHFEKYLCFALFCYVGVAFSPQRIYLAASHTAFRTPRLLLTQQLPDFHVDSREEEQCLAWMWLVLTMSWIATEDMNSTTARDLSTEFLERFPTYSSWTAIEQLMAQFFCAESLTPVLKGWWDGLDASEPKI